MLDITVKIIYYIKYRLSPQLKLAYILCAFRQGENLKKHKSIPEVLLAFYALLLMAREY